jgi:hypothetical protein
LWFADVLAVSEAAPTTWPRASGILAHGVGSRHDLPLPLDLVLQGAAIALLVSFLALGLLWKKPRFGGAIAGRVVEGALRWPADSTWPRVAAQGLALAFGAFVMVIAVFGPSGTRNAAPYAVYVLFWVGLAIISMLLGPVWRVINPLRLLHGILRPIRGRRSVEREYPAWLGHWPAAVGLFAFTWMELAAPGGSTPYAIALFFGCHVVVQTAGALVFGDRWFENADPFEVYSTMLGHLGPLGRRSDGGLVIRSPFDGLAAIPIRPGLVAVVAVCLGSTAFDSLAGTPTWAGFVQSSGVSRPLAATVGLALTIAILAASYWAVTWRAGRTGTPGSGPQVNVTSGIAHSLVPIVAGYVVAHYYSLLAVEGQRALILLSDPFGTGANVLGLSGLTPSEAPGSPGIVAAVQVIAVLVGHLVGVVAAHDSALRLLPSRQQLTGQAPLLLLMVGFTAGGLALLFAG